ncbi:NAD(P)/FAD-dependent oxidoreductase [Candidatus Harpocratesius sp.]
MKNIIFIRNISEDPLNFMNLDVDYDVIIVGAGCAGPAAAKKSAELGLKTLLVEKSLDPGAKNVSGTCLNMAALGDADLHYIMKCPIEREIHSMRTYHISKDRTTVFTEMPKEGVLLLSIRRDEFDKWHTEQARQAGAEIRLGTAVVDIIQENDTVKGVILESGEKLKCHVVIDGGGVNSIVGRKAGLIPKRSGKNMILYITAAVYLGEEIINERFKDEQGGCCIEYYLAPGTQYKTWPWIFPKKDTVTLGTGGYMTQELINDEFPTVEQYMRNFMNLPIIQKKIEGGKIESWGLHLEYDNKIEQKTKNGLILTGEAGGFVIPFLGEGMPEAFLTGIYAAKTAATCIKKRDVSQSALSEIYENMIQENLFLQGFMYVGEENKKSILSKSDEEIVEMMQSVIMGGGFITNTVHTKWFKGVENGSIDEVEEAKTFLEFIQPYRQVSTDYMDIYREMRAQVNSNTFKKSEKGSEEK